MNSPKPVSWSFSAMGAFETCAWRYYLTRVAKTIKEPETEATRWGTDVHKHMELRVTENKPLPSILSNWEATMGKLLAVPGEKFAERQLCLNAEFKPTDWFAKDAWLRCVIDFGVLNADCGMAIDWKTGKKKPGSDQLQLFAATMFHTYEQLEAVNTGFFWMKEKRPLDAKIFRREELPKIWGDWLPRVHRLEEAFAKDRWPKKPSGLCREWCPVGKSQCEHCGRK